jgi:hypothetical protein
MRTTRLIRGVTLSSLMSSGMAVAHILGGGTHELTFFAPIVFLISSVFFACLSPKRLEGPALASYILGFQVLGHLSFSSSTSDSRMSASHIVAAILTYGLVLHFQELIDSVLRYFRALFPVFLQPFTKSITKSLTFIGVIYPALSPHLSKVSNRAPPFCAAI